MEDLINWEPQSVADLAKNLSRIANEYRSNIAGVYRAYNRMGIERIWTGKNFNLIASDAFNQSRNIFEEWADYLQYTIPETLYEIAKTQSDLGGGNIDFSIYTNTDEIQSIDLTEERADGSQILIMDQIRNIVNNEISDLNNNSIKKIDEYYNQFEELNSLYENLAVATMYEQLNIIMEKNKKLLKMFDEEIKNSIELSLNEIQITNENSIKIANKINTIIK